MKKEMIRRTLALCLVLLIVPQLCVSFANADNAILSVDNRIGNSMRYTSLVLNRPVAMADTGVEERAIPIDASAGWVHTVFLGSDGRVFSTTSKNRGTLNVDQWSDVTQISVGMLHVLGLKKDGTVLAAGNNEYLQREVGGIKDVVQIAAGGYHSVYLKSDGTVTTRGKNDNGQRNADAWKDIIYISAGTEHTIGVKSNGTVVAAGNNGYGQCNVSDWRNIVSVSGGQIHTVGLRADGTVVAAGSNQHGQCDVGEWTDIVAIAAGYEFTLGLRADGTVLATGSNTFGQCDVSGWKNISAIAAGARHSVGVAENGEVFFAGSNADGQCVEPAFTERKAGNYVDQIDSEFFSVKVPTTQELVFTENIDFLNGEVAIFGSYDDGTFYEIVFSHDHSFSSTFNDLRATDPYCDVWFYFSSNMVINQINAKLQAKAGIDDLLVEEITRTYIGGLPAISTQWYYIADTYTSGEDELLPMFSSTYIIPDPSFGMYRIEVQSIGKDHRQELFKECISTIRWKTADLTSLSNNKKDIDIYEGFYNEMIRWFQGGYYNDVIDYLLYAEMLGSYRDSNAYYEKARIEMGEPEAFEKSYQKATEQFTNGSYEDAEYNFRMLQAFHVPGAKEMRMKCLERMNIRVPKA